MATKFQIKRSSVSGRTPNTTNAANSSYIAAGELALNLTDKKMYSSNGTNYFEIGSFKVEQTNSTSNVSTFTEISTLQFDQDSGFAVTSPSTGVAKIAINSTFKFWQVDGVQKLTAAGLDTVNFIGGNNISITANGANTPQSIAFATSMTPTFTSVTFGNSTVNTTINSSSIAVTKIFANGVTGSAGQVLSANSTGGIYWETSAGGAGTLTVTSDTFNGNGSNTIFTLSTSSTTDRSFVYLNGVQQAPTTDYTISGTTLTFVAAPASNNVIEVRSFDIPSIADITITSDTFTANGTQTNFTLSTPDSSVTNSLVFLNGVTQVPTTDYTLSSTTLTFLSAPVNGTAVQAISFTSAGVKSAAFTGNGSNTQFTLPVISTTSKTIVAINGVTQTPVTDYSVSGTTLIFAVAPVNNDNILVRVLPSKVDSAGGNTQIQYNKSGSLGGSAGFTFNDTTNNVVVGNTLTVPNFILNASNPPANSTSTGTTGTFAWDSSFFYVATGTNTWKKVPISANGVVGSAVTAGSNTEIQFNNSGSLGANSNFKFDSATTLLTVGNSTVNTTVNSIAVTATKIIANGAFGSNGQVLTSNGTAMYWGTSGGGGSGLVRDAFTANSTVNNNFTLSKEPANEAQTLVFVDSVLQRDADYSLSGTTLLFAANLDNGAELDVYISDPATTEIAGANTNIIFNDSDFANGSAAFTFNKTTNTLNLSNTLAIGSNVTVNASAIFIGNSSVNTTITAGNVHLQGTQLTVGNVVVNGNQLVVGNVTITDTQITVGNSTVNTVIGQTGSLSGNGALLTSVNASSISSGTLDTARLPATVNVSTAINVGANVNITTSSITVGNSTVNSVLTSTSLTTNTANVFLVTVGSNVTVNTSAIKAGNSTANITIGSDVGGAGGNLYLKHSGTSYIYHGNSTVNATIGSAGFVLKNNLTSSGAIPAGDIDLFFGSADSPRIILRRNNGDGNQRIPVAIVAGLGAGFDGVSTTDALRVTSGTSAATTSLPNNPEFQANATLVYIGNSTVNTQITSTSIETDGTLAVLGAATLSSTLAAGNTTITGDLVVSGNVFFNGATTNVNSTNLVVEDKNIILGDVTTPSDVTADGGGITLKGATDKTLNWVDASDAWTSSEEFNLVSGKSYRINGTAVVNSTSLGTGITGSSLTSVGTLTTLATGNTTVTGFINISSTANVGGVITARGNVTVNGALVVANTAALGNTTITGFANVSTTLQVGTNTATFGTAVNIVANGHVGIGTASPVTKFVVSNGGALGLEVAPADGILQFYNRSTSAYGNFICDGGTFIWRPSGTEAMRLDSSGNLGIGTTAPRGNLDVGHAAAGMLTRSIHLGYAAADFYGFRVANINDAAATYAGTFAIQRGTGSAWNNDVVIDNNGNLGIGTTTMTGKLNVNGDIRTAGGGDLRLSNNGDPSITADDTFLYNEAKNLIVWANGSERARITSAGVLELTNGQIKFPATQSASADVNTLDDYEEGSWTPRLSGSSGGDYTPSGINDGRYIKIGKMVWATCTLQWSAQVTAFLGNLVVSGLPFTSAGVRTIGAMGAVNSGLLFTAGYGEWNYLMDPGYTFVYIIQNSTTGAGYSHAPTVQTSGLVYALTIVYQASS